MAEEFLCSRFPFVAMMQSADSSQLNDFATTGRLGLDRSLHGSEPVVKREVLQSEIGYLFESQKHVKEQF